LTSSQNGNQAKHDQIQWTLAKMEIKQNENQAKHQTATFQNIVIK